MLLISKRELKGYSLDVVSDCWLGCCLRLALAFLVARGVMSCLDLLGSSNSKSDCNVIHHLLFGVVGKGQKGALAN